MHDRSVDPVVAEIFSKATKIPVDGHCGIRHPESGSTQMSREIHFIIDHPATIGSQINDQVFISGRSKFARNMYATSEIVSICRSRFPGTRVNFFPPEDEEVDPFVRFVCRAG